MCIKNETQIADKDELTVGKIIAQRVSFFAFFYLTKFSDFFKKQDGQFSSFLLVVN